MEIPANARDVSEHQQHEVRLPPVRLREIRDEDDEFLSSLNTPDVEGPWNSFDDPPEERLNGAHYEGGARIVELFDGTPVGLVSWIRIPHGPNRRSLAWNIGITIFPTHRGRRLGAAAQRCVADDLLAHSDANLVTAETDIENVAEQRSLERAGFTREGVARAAQWRRGAWHDCVIYSRLRTD
jgi:RimJ/RimL family protein N-acetyltransferase